MSTLRFEGNCRDENVADGIFICEKCKEEFSTRDGIIHFQKEDGLKHMSRRYRVVQEIYHLFFTPLNNLMFLYCGGTQKARQEVLEHLEIFHGANILETGIGTGDNLPILNGQISGCSFYGIDIKDKLLNACNRNMKRHNIEVSLFHGDAEKLPFRDEAFDIVFHLGAINHFKDQKKAISEMIRVAKKGSRIVIADETQKGARLMNIFVGRQKKVVPPVEMVPDSMVDIRLETIWNGYGYLLEFRKPEN
ncbi:MAG: class I SAM-dependent methyltransferase [Bacteroidota bacterium]|nr:class I SAM-dependent methyltransferase [Bacteroidota bacterium]